MKKNEDIRKQMIATCIFMNERGINQGTSGNISVRVDGGFLITPSGVPYDEMKPADIVFMKLDGSYEHALAPSSEWRFHRDIYAAKSEVGAVVHAHPTHCTALAIRGLEIPAVHYINACAGGPNIRCAGYHTYGTAELSQAAIVALKDRTGCLHANHGMIATGATLGKAMWLAIEMETLARQYILSLQLGGPNILPDDEIARVVAKFKNYGLKEKA